MELEQAERQQNPATGSDRLSREAQALSKRKPSERSGERSDSTDRSALSPEPQLPDNPLIPKHDYSEKFPQANGMLRYNLNADGRTIRESVLRTNAAPNGDYDETYYGQRPEDNVNVTRRLQTDDSVKFHCLDLGNRELGAITVNKDGTSLVHTKDANGNKNHSLYDKNRKLTDKITITKDEQGNSIEDFSSGARRVRYTDNSKYERAVRADKSGTETYYGRQDEKLYTEEFDNNGKFAERGPQEVRLRDLVEKLDQKSKDKYLACIDQLKQRSQSGQVTRVESQLTFKAAADLLAAGGNVPLNKKQIRKLAGDILENAAHPNGIYQGFHKTCPVASKEIEIYWRHPALPAMAVAQIGLTGHYIDDLGHDFAVDPTPHDTSKLAEAGENNRNHASEIYQVLTMKKALLMTGQQIGRSLDYSQIDVASPTNLCDTGERITEILADGSIRPSLHPDGAGLTYSECARLGKEMLKQLPSAIILGDDKIRSGPNAPKTESVFMVHADFGNNPDCVSFSSEEQFGGLLVDYHNRGQFPICLSVGAVSSPFLDQRGGWIDPTESTGHGLTITDIKVDNSGKPISAKIDNSWATVYDTEVTFHDLYLATRHPPNNVDTLAVEVAREFNPARELDLIRLKMITQTEPIEQGVGEVQALLDRCTVAPGGLTDSTKKSVLAKTDPIVRSIQPNLAITLLLHEQRAGFLTEKDCYDRLKGMAAKVAQDQALRKYLPAEKVAQNDGHLAELQNYFSSLPARWRTEMLNHLQAKQKQFEKP